MENWEIPTAAAAVTAVKVITTTAATTIRNSYENHWYEVLMNVWINIKTNKWKCQIRLIFVPCQFFYSLRWFQKKKEQKKFIRLNIIDKHTIEKGRENKWRMNENENG